MKSKKSIGRRIIEWFSENTWIYGATLTILLCGVLAFLAISMSKETTDGDNMFIGGRYWPIKIESSSESGEESSIESGEESSIVNSEESAGASDEDGSSEMAACSGEHVWEILERREPTCTGYGVTKYICTVCGDTSKKVAISPLGHVYIDGACARCGSMK